jgi:hypothetical protein
VICLTEELELNRRRISGDTTLPVTLPKMRLAIKVGFADFSIRDDLFFALSGIEEERMALGPELFNLRCRFPEDLAKKLIVSVGLDSHPENLLLASEEEQNNPYNTEGPQENNDLWYNRIII